MGGLATGGEAITSDAVLLFVERARRVQSTFALTPANAAAVDQICRLVGGTPLAIELAASWLPTLSPAEIAAELERSLDLLGSVARDLPTRHRSVRTDNLRAALRAALTLRQGDAGASLCMSLYALWAVRGMTREGLQWVEQFLALEPLSSAARGRLLTIAALMQQLPTAWKPWLPTRDCSATTSGPGCSTGRRSSCAPPTSSS